MYELDLIKSDWYKLYIEYPCFQDRITGNRKILERYDFV